jgi:HSP20 family protein
VCVVLTHVVILPMEISIMPRHRECSRKQKMILEENVVPRAENRHRDPALESSLFLSHNLHDSHFIANYNDSQRNMKFTTSTLIAAAALATTGSTNAPTMVQAWNMGGGGCGTPMILSSPAVEMHRRRRQAMINRAFQQLEWQQFEQNPNQERRRQGGSPFQTISPRFEITDNETQVQIAMDVPGVKMEDIDVSLEDNVLTIRGQRDVTARSESNDDALSSSSSSMTKKFSQSFSLNDPTIVVEKITASLENGVLVVAAPKDIKRIEENIRKIPITTTSLKDELASTTTTTNAKVMDDSAGVNVADDVMQPLDDETLQEAPIQMEAKEEEDGAPDKSDDEKN